MKFQHAHELAESLRELADFIEVSGPQLPEFYSPGVELTAYLTETDYTKDEESGEYKSSLNEEKTKRNLARFLAAIGPCEKKYNDDNLNIVRKFGKRGSIRGNVTRALTCRKIVKGTHLQQATLIPARMVEDVEWVCDEQPSLMKLVNS